MNITFTIPCAFLCTILAELRHQPYHVVVGDMGRHVFPSGDPEVEEYCHGDSHYPLAAVTP
jgi:hypothetical protein